tara:strand:- start:190 stop:441 length:252 start_codon:yes stop_codon:yes gene_type:complete
MNWDKYTDKKAKSLVAFEKDGDVVVLKEKQYDAETGEAMDDKKTEYIKVELESIKTGYETEATRNTNLAKALEVAIEDFDKVK